MKKGAPMQHIDNYYKELSSIFALLSSELRLKIIHILSQKESTVSEIVAQVNASKYNVSQQLRQLALLGLIERKKVGRFVYCKLKGELNWDMVEQLRLTTSASITTLPSATTTVDQHVGQKELSA
jgi:DNA-binding transcriptional ArsR family regulator